MQGSIFETSTDRLMQFAAISYSFLVLMGLGTVSLAEPAPEPDSLFLYDDKLIKLAIEFDDAGTRYLVARKFYRGNDYPQNKKKAAHWFELAANAGHIKSQYYLGRMYLHGDGIKANYELGRKYLKLAGNAEHLDSMLELAKMYRTGVGGKKANDRNALFWYKKAALRDDADGAFYYGKFLYEGRGGEKKQIKAALEWLRLAAEIGYPDAERYLRNISGTLKSESQNENNNLDKLTIDADNDKTSSNNISKVRLEQHSGLASADNAQNKETIALEFQPDQETSRYTPLVNSAALQHARRGNVDAQFNIGMQYFETGIEYQAAAKWLRKAAEHDHAGAQLQLGKMYRDGIGVKKSDSEAIKWLRLASSWGISDAYRSLDQLLRKQLIADERVLFEQNPELRDPDAQYTLGIMYAMGKKVKQDTGSAIQWLHKAALQNHSEAQFKLGEIYRDGNGIEANYRKAKQWLEKSSKLGNDRASSALQVILNDEEQEIVNEHSTALNNSSSYAILSKAKRGDTHAQFNIGMAYINGKDIASDTTKGILWLEKASNANHTQAQLALANLYFEGKKIRNNYTRALHWYHIAAETGSAEAQFNLGAIYHSGLGVRKNNALAIKWFRLAARQGHAKARKKLGGCRIC
ncbi:MAG: hypothetical protein ACC707_05105 [Thiohalomonadales bacterium]